MNDNLHELLTKVFKNIHGKFVRTNTDKQLARTIFWPKKTAYKKVEINRRNTQGKKDFDPDMKNMLEQWCKYGAECDSAITGDKGPDGKVTSYTWRLSAMGHKVRHASASFHCPGSTLFCQFLFAALVLWYQVSSYVH